MLVAQLVGPGGRVVSFDLDQASVETAQKRSSAVGYDNTTYHQADISTFADGEPFDAIVGRLVLEFLPDPIAASYWPIPSNSPIPIIIRPSGANSPSA
jgi:protein-L-isoaspartate O-methyltransferase